MEYSKPNTSGEVNLRNLIKKIYDRKIYFLISLFICVIIAYAYIKIATPIYEVSTSLLIDPSGQNRQLGQSKYVDGGIGLIEAEKNLYNEIAILKSYSLIEQAFEDLNFDVSYFTGSTFKKSEHYQYFPFEVEVLKNRAQLYGALFQVEIIDTGKFKLSVKTRNFSVFNPVDETIQEMKSPFEFSKVYGFGDPIEHDFFNIKINKTNLSADTEVFKDKKLLFQVHSLQGLANEYFEKLEVNQVDIQASILKLNVSGPCPQKEIDFLKALSRAFINRKLLERDEIAAGKESFIRAQLKSIGDSLQIAEKKLQSFKSGTNAVDLTRSASNALDRLQALETDKGQIALNIKYYQSLLNYINDNQAIDKIVAPSVAGINDPLLSENLVELKRLHNEKTRLEFYKGAKSYDIVLIKEQIVSTTNALKENIRNLINTARLQLKDRNQQIAQFESTISQLPQNEKQLVNYERESTLYGNMYNYLNQELAKTGIARAEDISDTKVIDKARQLGDAPIAPQKLLIMLLAVIIGFLIPLIGLIFSDGSQDRLQTAEQIEQFSAIPLLANIGHFNNSLSSLANYKSDREKEETFRNLSANLQFRIPGVEHNVIGITSALQGEGKTFCALNLAVNYANAGKKTLLIDLNFRNPVLARGLNLEQVPDLKTYILNASFSAERICHQHQDIPNLFYTVTKAPEPNPHLFLTNKRLDTLITALKYEYDYIIIDTPAIGLVSDYLLIAKHTDINLFVCRKGKSNVSHLNDIEELIRKGSMKNPFIVFNGTSTKIKVNPAYTENNFPGKANPVQRLLNLKKSVS